MNKARSKDDDWTIFTSTVLLISSASRIAREELDRLIMERSGNEHETKSLRHAQSGVAELAAIADHFNQEIADD